MDHEYEPWVGNIDGKGPCRFCDLTKSQHVTAKPWTAGRAVELLIASESRTCEENGSHVRGLRHADVDCPVTIANDLDADEEAAFMARHGAGAL